MKIPKYKPAITFDQSCILGRKFYIGYMQPSQNKSKDRCETCDFFNQITPYMSRCAIVSFSELKEASINPRGRCKYYGKGQSEEKIKEIQEKLPLQEDIKVFDMYLIRTVSLPQTDD